MFDKFRKGNFKLLCGVRLGERNENLIEYAHQFVDLAGAKLRIVNVVEPWGDHPWISVLPGENLQYSIAATVEDNAIKDAERDLAKMSGGLDIKEGFEFNAMKGDVAASLAADAVSSKSTMICVSIDQKTKASVLSGMSTAIALAAHSKIPVMIVPEERKDFDPDGRLKVMYADDLRPESVSSLSTAMELVYGLGNLDFFHCHISGTSRDDMDKMSKKVLQLLDMDDVDLDPSFNIVKLFEDSEKIYRKKLSDRAGVARALIASRGVEYIQRVQYGKVNEGLDVLIKEIDPDVVVFGRHHMIHKEPFGIGKLPFNAMLSFNRPIIIAPGRS